MAPFLKTADATYTENSGTNTNIMKANGNTQPFIHNYGDHAGSPNFGQGLVAIKLSFHSVLTAIDQSIVLNRTPTAAAEEHLLCLLD